MAYNPYSYTYEWARRVGGNPSGGENELSLLKMVASARGATTVGYMNRTGALRSIATSYGKAAGNYNTLQSLRSIVDVLGATPAGRNLSDLNSLDCLRAIVGGTADASGGGTPALLSETTDWETAVIGNSGTVSAETLAAVNARIVAAKAHGYWDLLERANWFCGDQLATAQVPVKVENNAPNLIDTLVNFVAGHYSEATGLTGDGLTTYLDTGMLANVLAANDTHLAVYNRSSVAANNYTIGAEVAVGTSSFILLAPWGTSEVYGGQYNQVAGQGGIGPTAIVAPFGSIIGTRTASNSHRVYRNGVQIATSATTGGALPALSIYVFAGNLNGAAGSFSNYALGGYSIGAGLTAQQALDYSTDEEVFQDALGRGVA